MMNFVPIFAFLILAQRTAHASTLQGDLMAAPETSQLLFDDGGNDHMNNTKTCTSYVHPIFGEHWPLWFEEDDDDGRFCTISTSNAVEECIYDFTDVVSEGGFEYPGEICSMQGGTLYLYDAVITCSDDSSYTYVKDVAGCYSDCNTRLAVEKVRSQITEFMDIEDKQDCRWTFITIGTLEETVRTLEANDDLILRLGSFENFYWNVTSGRDITLQEDSQNNTKTNIYAM